ncbi:MAG: hypothetical protein WBI57_03630 [Desulfobacterales bacterium]
MTASPMAPHALLMKAWNAMGKIQKTGGALQLGISNCYDIEVIRSLYADANVKPAVVQNRFYQETGYDADLRHWCYDHGVIYQSFWTLTANPHILSSNIVRIIAQKYKKIYITRILLREQVILEQNYTKEKKSVETFAEPLQVFFARHMW